LYDIDMEMKVEQKEVNANDRVRHFVRLRAQSDSMRLQRVNI